VCPHLVTWEGAREDTKMSYSACLRKILQNGKKIKVDCCKKT
jgi:hypothetical protein